MKALFARLMNDPKAALTVILLIAGIVGSVMLAPPGGWRQAVGRALTDISSSPVTYPIVPDASTSTVAR